ncbi:MAG: hypothetical protein ACK493_04220 [Planctomycetota bacterium]
MATYWCGNFDTENTLGHGLAINSWLMQYQYAHSGFDYQGTRRQKKMTTEAWKMLKRVSVGDWIIAYLPNNTFFAFGQICEHKTRKGVQVHSDSIKRTIAEACHLHFDGVVKYKDAPAFYEDFTDKWNVQLKASKSQPRNWLYAQRIDVADWKGVVMEGVQLPGLAKAAPLPEYRKPLFEVDADFFQRVKEALELNRSKLKR